MHRSEPWGYTEATAGNVYVCEEVTTEKGLAHGILTNAASIGY